MPHRVAFYVVSACCAAVAVGATLYIRTHAVVPDPPDPPSPTAQLDERLHQLMREQSKTDVLKPVALLHGHSDGVLSIDFSPDSKTLASAGGDQKVKLWDMATFKEIATLEAHSRPVETVRFSRDGTRLLSSSWEGSSEGAVIVWDAKAREPISRCTMRPSLTHAEFLPDGKCFVAAANDRLVIGDIDTQTMKPTSFYADRILSLDVSDSGEVLVGTAVGEVFVWDSSQDKVVAKRQRRQSLVEGTPEEVNNWVNRARFLGNGHILIADSDAIWDWNRRSDEIKLLIRLCFRDFCLFDDNRIIAANDQQGFAYLTCDGMWQAPCMHFENDNGHQVAVSPDQRFVAVARGGTWDRNYQWHSDGPQDIEVFDVARVKHLYQISQDITAVQIQRAAARGIPIPPPSTIPIPAGAPARFFRELVQWK